MSSNLLDILGDLAREQAEPGKLDPWERLARGDVGEAEDLELRRLSDGDPEAARLYAAYAPLGREAKAGICTAIARSLQGGMARVDELDGDLDGDMVTLLEAVGHPFARKERRGAALPASRRTASALVGGRYRIDQVVGSGSMGSVMRARDLLQDVTVAIKFFDKRAFGPDEVTRRLREARVLASIRSEHAVKIFDAGVTDDGVGYVTMEYLEGRDLSGWLKQHGALPAKRAVDFVLQACDALAEAHARGIVHTDIKPANLFAVEDVGAIQSIKVLGFDSGLRTPSGSPGDEWYGFVTSDAPTFSGTPLYMAPEQMEGSRDHRSDIWSLGITLTELVTGGVPFEEATLVRLYARIASGALPRLRERRPELLSPGLEAVILKCLERDPDRRYRTVAELARALSPFGSDSASSHATPEVSREPGSRRAGDSGAPRSIPVAATRRARRPSLATTGRIAIAVAALALVVAVGVVVSNPAPVDTRFSRSAPGVPSSPSEALVPTDETAGPLHEAAVETRAASPSPASDTLRWVILRPQASKPAPAIVADAGLQGILDARH